MRRTIYLISLIIIISLSGCSDPSNIPQGNLPLADMQNPASWSTTAPADFQTLKSSFLQTFEMEKVVGIADRGIKPVLYVNETAETVSRATVPVWPSARTFVDGTISDYPEQGLTTNYTVTVEDAGLNIYRIVSTTVYPVSNTLVDTYIEEYLVEDMADIGVWDFNDPVVDAVYTADPLAREKMELHFDDGTVRYEQIVMLTWGSDGFAAFDINSSLSYPDFAFPSTDANAEFSSIVVYRQDISESHSYWFWEGTVSGALLGVRFYTEHFVDGGAYYKGTMAVYERAVQTYVSSGGDFTDQLTDIFVGSEHTTLAESVLRKEVLFDVVNGSMVPTAIGGNTVMRTHIVDTAGLENTDFLIQLLNDDAAVFDDWDNAPYHIPSGTTADEIEAAIPASELTVDLYSENPDGSLMLLLGSVNPADGSDLATLYRSIIDGFADNVITPGNDIVTEDLPPTPDGEDQTVVMETTGVAEFDTTNGYEVPGSATAPALNPDTSGTVEAWVYVNKHEDTAGIVHKGIETDFSDEGYSLQFWGKRGNVAFALADQNPYDFRVVSSGLRLNTGKWYYLAGRWDVSTIYLDIYYNDKNGNTKSKHYTTSNTIGVPFADSGPLVIGSQFVEAFGRAGYYGFDGKINGVVVSTYTKDTTELETFYDNQKSKTNTW